MDWVEAQTGATPIGRPNMATLLRMAQEMRNQRGRLMAICDVITDVCLAVGVAAPGGSMFPTSPADRTKAEMISLANEMAQRIACNTRDWTALRQFAMITSDGVLDEYPLPTNYHRMLKSGQVYRGVSKLPMRFVNDADDWLRTEDQVSGQGDWMLRGRVLMVRPVSEFGTSYRFPYIANTCVSGDQTRFLSDTDTFMLDERLLKLGMIWQWKAQKGGSYIEDMQNYEDALAFASANDKPSPVIVGKVPISHAVTAAYPYPLGGV